MKIVKTRDVIAPHYSSDGAAGIDFYVPFDIAWESFTLKPGECIKIPSGIKVELEHLTCLLATNRSSKGADGLVVGATLIDEDYRGEIHLSVINSSNKDILLKRGDKLIQFMHLPVYRLPIIQLKDESKFSTTKRGEGRFGSTDTDSKCQKMV